MAMRYRNQSPVKPLQCADIGSVASGQPWFFQLQIHLASKFASSNHKSLKRYSVIPGTDAPVC